PVDRPVVDRPTFGQPRRARRLRPAAPPGAAPLFGSPCRAGIVRAWPVVGTSAYPRPSSGTVPQVGDDPDGPPRRELRPGLHEQLELGYAFGGLPTFGQRPLLTDPEQLDEWRPDVAIVGAPFDVSTSNRPGARFGPRAIR